MFENVFLGIAAGLVFSISFGPVFVAITETSLRRGFMAGAAVALGVAISDVIYVVVILMGLSNLLEDPRFESVFALVGGMLLLLIGISLLVKKGVMGARVDKKRRHVGSFFKGFLINSLHPYVPIFWLGVVASVKSQLNLDKSSDVQFFAGVLTTMLVVDVLKSYMAEVLRKRVAPYATIVFRIIGGIFFVFGLKLLFDFVTS